ncbi:MAG: imidazole glycerol phosphate synthase subunit HisF [Acidimicrobiia bacterium]|nr:imidazole glycerol phosphate synthase subunit HisF [Acidimicrobiia bacterium]
MVATRVIACLDVDGGRVVKGVRFSGLRDAGDPVEAVVRYEAQGADEVVLLDISATNEARRTAIETVASIRSHLSIPLTVGGGIRTMGEAATLLERGADRIAVNSAAVADPDLIDTLAATFGVQCVVVAVDARATSGGWEVLVRSGSASARPDAVAWCKEAQERGAGEVLLTSFDRDGTRSGYDLDLIGRVRDRVTIPIIASGGAGSVDDLGPAVDAGASAVLVASLLHDGEVTVGDLKTALVRSGAEVRP